MQPSVGCVFCSNPNRWCWRWNQHFNHWLRISEVKLLTHPIGIFVSYVSFFLFSFEGRGVDWLTGRTGLNLQTCTFLSCHCQADWCATIKFLLRCVFWWQVYRAASFVIVCHKVNGEQYCKRIIAQSGNVQVLRKEGSLDGIAKLRFSALVA